MNIRETTNVVGVARSSSAALPLGGSTKRIFDLTFGSFVLVVMLPFMLFMALIIWCSDGRPIFIRHKRIGHGGTEFSCLKFRTMVVDAEDALQKHLAGSPAAAAEWATCRKLRNDPRITDIGHLLRKSSLDEFPQLLNIVRGDMSFVGPRPIIEDEAKLYGPYFLDYASARPGLTGPWQVSGRNDVSYQGRVQLDHEYVCNWSFGSDLIFILRTIPAVLASRGSY